MFSGSSSRAWKGCKRMLTHENVCEELLKKQWMHWNPTCKNECWAETHTNNIPRKLLLDLRATLTLQFIDGRQSRACTGTQPDSNGWAHPVNEQTLKGFISYCLARLTSPKCILLTVSCSGGISVLSGGVWNSPAHSWICWWPVACGLICASPCCRLRAVQSPVCVHAVEKTLPIWRMGFRCSRQGPGWWAFSGGKQKRPTVRDPQDEKHPTQSDSSLAQLLYIQIKGPAPERDAPPLLKAAGVGC